MSTDPLWAASGDIVYATGDDASSVLAVGSAGYVLTVNCDSTLKWAAGFTGPACSTDNAIPTFHGTGGATFQDTTVTISDSNVLTADAGIVVDNFTLDGTELDLSSGSFTLDVAADIEINADGGCINFKDADLALAAIVNSSCVGELRIHEAANYIGFKAPALSANQIWTLPAAVASCACDVLTCDGNGVLSWATASGGGGGACAIQMDDNIKIGFGGGGCGGDSVIYFDTNDTVWDLQAGDLVIAQAACHPSPDPGQVHLWAGTAGSVTATSTTQLTIEDNTNTGISILSPACAFGAVYFGDPGSNIAGGLIYNHGGPYFCMRVEANNVHRITATSIQAADGCACTPGLAFKGDPNTGFFKPTGDIISVAGNGSEKMRMNMTGGCGTFIINDSGSASGDIANGIVLNQGSNDDQILAFKSSDVVHDFVCVTDDDTYGAFKKASAAAGGLEIIGFSEGVTSGLVLRGAGEETCCANSNSAIGGIHMITNDDCSGGTLGVRGCNANLVSFSTGGQSVVLVKGNGDLHTLTGSITDAFDAYCDVALLTAARGIMASCKSPDFKQSLSNFVDEYACVLEQTGVLTLNRDTNSVPFMSHHAMFGLIIDTIRQVGGRVAGLETELKALQGGCK